MAKAPSIIANIINPTTRTNISHIGAPDPERKKSPCLNCVKIGMHEIMIINITLLYL